MPMDWGFDVMQGFTTIPAVATGPTGTGAADVVGSPEGQTQGQAREAALSPVPGCAFCANPTVQQAAFIGAIVLLAIGWHLHLYSLME